MTLENKLSKTSGRKEVGNDDVQVLLNGLGNDVYAESKAEFYRTEEQIALYSAVGNPVQDDNPFARMIAETRTNKRSSIKAWDKLLKFYGYKVEGKFKKTIPEEIKNLHRKIKTFLINRHSNFSSFDASLKTDDNSMKISMKSSVLDEITDLIIQDKTGATRRSVYQGYKYCFDLSRTHVIYYKCTDHKMCNERGKLDMYHDTFYVTQDHCHAAPHEDIEKLVTYQQLKEEVALNLTASNRQIYDIVSIKRKSDFGENFNTATVPLFHQAFCWFDYSQISSYPGVMDEEEQTLESQRRSFIITDNC